MNRVSIIGGGIGGLTAAHALRQAGLDFELYEQAPALTEVGAGIGLSKAAVRVLDWLHLGEPVRQAGTFIRHGYLLDKGLRVRRKLPADLDSICIHRARLIDILGSGLPAGKIHLSRRITRVDGTPAGTTLGFADGSTATAPLAIAADGIHSAIRSRFQPQLSVRYIGQTIWRGVAPVKLPDPYAGAYVEIWDENKRFVFVPAGADQVFWLAVKPAPPGEKDHPETLRDDLMGLFRNFHPLVREMIATSRNFIRNDMGDLGTQPRRWYHDRIVFLGDAIHATTPNLAQGGCQAIEDAYCLALCLRKYPSNPAQAFQTYYELRHRKSRFVVDTSWKLGKWAHSGNPLFDFAYKALLRYAPDRFFTRQEAYLNDLSYLQSVR
ncbi:MAG: FAD-dependent monooxygenase [Cytophagales bacterium]|nr:FAD-dependent monooxygenase [Cytophagales bacterium]